MKKNKIFNLVLVALSFLMVAQVAFADSYDLAEKKTEEIPVVTTMSSTVDYLVGVNGGTGQPFKIIQSNSAYGSVVALAVDTSITAATHLGHTLVLGGAGSSRTMTLPAATGTGNTYMFIVGAVNTSNYVIQKAGSDTIKGGLVFASDNALNAELGFETTGASIVTLNGTTKGGAAVGDYVVFQDIAAGIWVIRGQVTESGSEATPFS